MVVPTLVGLPRPTVIKRLPWMRRIQIYSPKAARMLVLFSYDSLAAWALAESCPLVEAFCEYPGFIPVDGVRVMADLWVRSGGHDQIIKIDGGVELAPEFSEQVATYVDVDVSRVTPDWFAQHRVWIDNWLQINPYLVTNARFVTAAMLDRVGAVFDVPRPVFDAEYALRDTDAQLVRTAVFMLMHRGELCSDDLVVRPLATTTTFRRPAPSSRPRSWPA